VPVDTPDDHKSPPNLCAGYLHSLQEQVGAAVASGWSLEETLERVAVPALLALPTTMPVTPESQALLVHLHRLNVLATYRELETVSPQEA
jgi:hypothetical protein